MIATISQTNVGPIPQTPSCSREKPADLLTKLEEDIGKPVGIELFSNDELRMWPDQSVPGFCSESPAIDATIQGVDTNQFVPAFQAVIRAYFDQDPAAFSSAIQQGVRGDSSSTPPSKPAQNWSKPCAERARN